MSTKKKPHKAEPKAAPVVEESAAQSGLKIVYWPIEKFVHYARNPRKNDSVVDRMVSSLKEFGFAVPVLARSDGEVVDGHLRLKGSAKAETWPGGDTSRIPVILCDEWTEAQVKAFRLLANRSVAWAEWDNELLGTELLDLKALDFDLGLTGFDPTEVTGFLMEAEKLPPGSDEDEVPEPPVHPVTVLGDLWVMGSHRVLCGDSTEVDAVERLMDGEKAGLMNTDPPYGVSYANDERPNPGVAKPRVAKPRVANDEFKDDELQEFLETVFATALTALNGNAAWYLWYAHLTQGFFAAAAAAAHVILHRQIIWVKPVLLLGRGQYHWKHEPCFMGWVQGNQPPDYGLGAGERTQTTVWELGGVTQAERKEFNHSTPKPVALFDIPINKHLKAGEICYEPFAGSGPQFVAAEKNNVRCFGLELAPQYCDVIVQRWQTFSSKAATLEGDGRTFDEIANERRANS